MKLSEAAVQGREAAVRRGTWIALLALGWVLAAAAAASADSQQPMRIRIEAPTGTRFNPVYRVDVIAPGLPIFIVAKQRVGLATLEVGGVAVETAGLEAPVSWQPLGRSRTVLRLSNLAPRDRVVIRVSGDPGGLAVIDDASLLTVAARYGLFNGFFFAFLLLIALFHVLLGLKSRDRTGLWYAAWALTIGVLSASHDGYFDPNLSAGLMLPVAGAAIGVCVVGFVSSYLRLTVDAPRLFWFAVACNVIGFFGPVVAIARVPTVAQGVFLTAGPVFGLVPMCAVAALRWRAGFVPAGAFVIGLALTSATFVIQFVLTLYKVDSALRNEWVLDMALMWDLSVFVAALAMRERYTTRERGALEAQLRRTVYDAAHDALTGLLNRRGFDEWLLATGAPTSTVFFIDLDGFKAVNDRGGHAAGDETLRAVSRIIRRSVRETDAVVRIGGDEFVVAFADAVADAEITNARTRIAAAVSALEPLGASDPTRIGASIGVCSMSASMSISDALSIADAGAYREKFERYARRGTSALQPTGEALTNRKTSARVRPTRRRSDPGPR